MGDVAKLTLFIFVIMGCFAYVATVVEVFYMRRDVADMRLILDQRLESYNAPTLMPDSDRRIERLEAGILVLAEGQKALTAKVDLIAHKLDHYTPTMPAALVPVSLSHGTKPRSLERESIQLQNAVAWLMANDKDLKLKTREAERLSGISRATINRAQHWIRST